MRALSICNPLLGEAEGSRRVPGENGWSQGPAASPGTVHSDPPQGDGQALCGCSAQLVHAEIMRDGAASAARHSASRGRRGGDPQRRCWPAFRTLGALAHTLHPELSTGRTEPSSKRTVPPTGLGAERPATPSARQLPRLLCRTPEWTGERTTVFTGKEMKSSRCQSPFLLTSSQP